MNFFFFFFNCQIFLCDKNCAAEMASYNCNNTN